jgi:hypothetical protein
MRLTQAVTHIRLYDANHAKITLLDWELAACTDRQAIRGLREGRHQAWREEQSSRTGWP